MTTTYELYNPDGTRTGFHPYSSWQGASWARYWDVPGARIVASDGTYWELVYVDGQVWHRHTVDELDDDEPGICWACDGATDETVHTCGADTDARVMWCLDDDIAELRLAMDCLEHLTTDGFSEGGDRPARKAIATVLHRWGALDAAVVREYGLDR